MGRILAGWICVLGMLVATVTVVGSYQSSSTAIDWVLAGGGSGSDDASTVGVDAAGNIYVAGEFSGTALLGGIEFTANAEASSSSFLTKLSADGEVIWVRVLPEAGFPEGMAVDAAGNAYLALQAADSSIVKYDSDGNPVWSRLLAGWTDAEDLALGPDGNLFFHGSEQVIKVTPDNQVLWTRSVGAWTSALAVAPDGSAWLYGELHGSLTLGATELDSGGAWAHFLARMNADGEFVYARALPGAFADEPEGALAVDGDGNVYLMDNFSGNFFVDGQLIVNRGNDDVYVLAFASDGGLRWAHFFGDSSTNYGEAIAVEGDQLHLAFSGGSRGTAHVSYRRLSLAGEMEDAFYISQEGGDISVLGCALSGDGTGFIATGWIEGRGFIGGQTIENAGDRDLLIFRLRPGVPVVRTGSVEVDYFTGPAGATRLEARSINEDGTQIVGTWFDASGYTYPMQWIENNGFTEFTHPWANVTTSRFLTASDLSGDGSVAVGRLNNAQFGGKVEGFIWEIDRWTGEATVLVYEELMFSHTRPASQNSRFTGISHDGQWVVGEFSTESGSPLPFIFDRTNGTLVDFSAEPAFQAADENEQIVAAWAYDVSADGTTVVIFVEKYHNDTESYSSLSYRWSAEKGLEALPLVAGATESDCLLISADGRIIAGSMKLADGRWMPTLWDENLTPTVLPFPDAWQYPPAIRAMSFDGRKIVGYRLVDPDELVEGDEFYENVIWEDFQEPIPVAEWLQNDLGVDFGNRRLMRLNVNDVGNVFTVDIEQDDGTVGILRVRLFPDTGDLEIVRDLPGGPELARLRAVSDDGSVFGGNFSTVRSYVPFYAANGEIFEISTGNDPQGLAFSSVRDITPDGSKIVGYVRHFYPNEPLTTGFFIDLFQPELQLFDSAWFYSVSDDGTVIAEIGGSVWINGDSIPLPAPEGGDRVTLYGVSGDGQTYFGYAIVLDDSGGYSALPYAYTQSTGPSFLPVPDGFSGYVTAGSYDGSVLFGSLETYDEDGNSLGSAQALWRNGILEQIEIPAGYTSAYVASVSGDGTLATGWMWTDGGRAIGCVYTDDTGLIPFADYIAVHFGASVGEVEPSYVWVSSNGQVFCGSVALHPENLFSTNQVGFIYRAPDLPPAPYHLSGTLRAAGFELAGEDVGSFTLEVFDNPDFLGEPVVSATQLTYNFITGSWTFQLELPAYDADLQPTGIFPGTPLYVQVFHQGTELAVRYPFNGTILMGAAGQRDPLDIVAGDLNQLWADATWDESGWRYSDWYGAFRDDGTDLIYHGEHGWQVYDGLTPDSVYFHDLALECWLWTSNACYPILYKYGSHEGWMQYQLGGTPGNRSFYHYELGRWFTERELVLNDPPAVE